MKEINIFYRLVLAWKGKRDGRRKMYQESSIVSGKYYTPYCDRKLSRFHKIKKVEFDRVNVELERLNKLIENCCVEREEIIKNTLSDVEKKQIELEDFEKGAHRDKDEYIQALKDTITGLLNNGTKAVTSKDSEAMKAINEANEMISSFNREFINGLNFCREELLIYWDALVMACKEKTLGVDINVEFPDSDELADMYKIDNPSEKFSIVTYNIGEPKLFFGGKRYYGKYS